MYTPVSSKAPFIWHGGDYNPEQWSSDVWQEDFRLMKKAGITAATVGVFSWVSLQPDEDTFTFEWLDEVIAGLHENGIKVVLATPTAAQPAWMSQKYPEVMRSDEYGIRKAHGRRVNYCPSSTVYRQFSAQIARKLAERYKDHPALILWHVSNEYGGTCMCETCAEHFREWLRARYGMLDELNARWWTRFWGHTYTDWSQIMPPLANGEVLTHGLNVDYMRFMTDTQLACFVNERDVLREITPDIPITTNMMGSYKPLNYRKWAKEVDVISWDSYPRPNQSVGEIAFAHDLNRGLKDGQPFLLLEQTPSSQNWQAVNALKRPGVLRRWSYLAVAHGADSVMYFQWRRGRGGCEKYHGAIIEHAGREDTRVFREVSQIGAELNRLGDAIVGARTPARIAVLLDWESWWALDEAVGPMRDKRYVPTVSKHYNALYNLHLPVDIVFPDSDFSQYDILIAPQYYMVKPGVAEKIEAMVASGGTFVTTHLSGMVDETDLACENGYPGPLQKVTGVWVEEIDALYEDQTNTIEMAHSEKSYTCGRLADIVRPQTAEVVATYGSDFYAGQPVVTRNVFGEGQAYYIGSDPEIAFLEYLYRSIADRYDLQPVLGVPQGVEVTLRQKENKGFLFILNHNDQQADVALPDGIYTDLLTGKQWSDTLTIDAGDVAIVTASD
ncbi:MAG: beta-galactosidase [Anaerolineae bacterium]|nr:beta-galactosidase [Anaerolineae bacterium]